MRMHTMEYVNGRTGNLSTYYSKADDHDGMRNDETQNEARQLRGTTNKTIRGPKVVFDVSASTHNDMLYVGIPSVLGPTQFTAQ